MTDLSLCQLPFFKRRLTDNLNTPETRKPWAASKKLQNWTKLKKKECGMVYENSYSRISFLYFTVMIALSSLLLFCEHM